jgi:hypothetical protein
MKSITAENQKAPSAPASQALADYRATLTIDRAHRYEGVRCGLYEAWELVPKEWDYSLPTLCGSVEPVSPLAIAALSSLLGSSLASFADKLNRRFPILAKMPWANLLLAGGAVQRTINNSFPMEGKFAPVVDLDLFIYGLDEEKALVKMGQVVQYAETFCKKSGYKVRYVRSSAALSIIITDPNRGKMRHYPLYILQVILRAYAHPSEVLHGFDLGSSAVGWNGHSLYFTALGKFAYEYGLNIFDNSRRSTTYEHRLKKYHSRGFGIVLESLDVKKVGSMPYKYVDMPRTSIAISLALGNCLNGEMYPKGTAVAAGAARVSDYGLPEILTEFSINRHNQWLVMSGKKEGFLFASDAYDDVILKGLLPSVIEEFCLTPQWILRTGMDLALFKRVYTVPHYEIIARRDEPGFAEEVVASEKAFYDQKMTEVPKSSPLRFRTVNPGTQLSGSFNPVLASEEEWYGEYYAKPAA